MEPEEIKPSIGKKLLNILLVVSVLLLILAITAFVLTKIKNSKIANIVEKQEIVTPPRELTEAEKLLKSQVEELDMLRAQNQNTKQATTTIQDQVKNMDALRTKQKTSTAIIPKTLEQQINEIDALRTNSN